MSDGDVSLIRDEDLLRRMWQQTEDFSRKKEIRAHMYRLREERLRSLYSPEPTVNPAKGCEFSSTQGHVKSFADQSFQSMKSKEVRDAGSPPKEFTYRGQDLKDLSNAGWNVESENRTTDDGHTHVKTVNANIEGRYDVDGGKGHFSAADHHKQAVTEYNDNNASLKRNEDYSNTSAHEQVVRQTEDGMHFTSTSSSSTSASKFEQVSSKHETVPYLTNDDYDLASQKSYDTNKNEEISTQKISKNSTYEQGLRSDCEQGELVSRKIEYPDNSTKVIVETRCLPDGTRVTSTRREFHAPSVQTSHSEHHSQQIRNESKATSYTTSQKRFHANESKQKIQDSINRNVHDIVDSQRTKDDHDFRTNNVTDYSDDTSHRRYHQDIKTTEINERKLHESITRHKDQNIRQHDVKEIRQYIDIEDNNMTKEKNIEELNNMKEHKLNENNRSETSFSSSEEVKKTRYYKNNEDHIQNITKDRQIEEPRNTIELESNKNSHSNLITSSDAQNIRLQDDTKETQKFKNIEEHVHNITNESNVKEKHEKKITDQYQTTYQTDYSQRKISKDWSPTHQAWASTLRSDTPSRTTRASSPGSKTYKSNTSSPRSSISPDKIYKRTPSRSGSPNKIDRNSPTRTISDKTYSSTQSSTYSVYETKSNRYTNDENSSPKNKSPRRQLNSPERKPQDEFRKRPSMSPEKEIKTPSTRPSISPQTKTRYPSDSDRYSPIRNIPTRKTPSPERKRANEGQTLPTFNSDECYRESDKITQTSSKIIVTQITSNTSTHSDDNVENTSFHLKNIPKSKESPENQPGYMRPTASSSPRNDRPFAPAKSSDSNRESSIKRTPSQSPERKYPVSKLDKVKEENNRFISEENKMYTRSSKNITSDSSVLHRKSPEKETSPEHHIKRPHEPIVNPDRKLSSPIRKSPTKDTPDTTHNSKTFESCISHTYLDDKNPEKSNDYPPTDFKQKPEETSPIKKSPTKETPKGKSIISNKQPSRESSPIKRNGSLDKDYSRPIEDISTISTEGHENIPIYNEPRDSVKRFKNRSPSRQGINSGKESSPTRNTISPSKESPKLTEMTDNTSSVTSATFVKNIGNIEQVSYDITKNLNEGDDLNDNKDDSKNENIISKANTKLDTRTSRRSGSPKKASKQTFDFIATERTNEENNESTFKERPRNLVTPSTSPTRKPKSKDTVPSSGQSSPTTTESGFVYFSSPREKILVTDLDDQEPPQTDSSKKLPTGDICHKVPPRRTPSPTKIPCRSPSPEKVIIKESLPRKSSLKKSSIDNTHLISSVKPPTSFLISPNYEEKDASEVTQHNLNKNKPIKNKPPLVRRETYEERCRKILGMTEEDSAATEKETIISQSKNCISSDTSPSISPCESPVQHENNDLSQEKYETVDVLDMTDQIYMQNKMVKPKGQIQTLSEIKCKKINTEISDENLNFHSDNYAKDLRGTSPQRSSTTSPERSTLTETGKPQDIKKEISQGVETYEFETDAININTAITGTQNLTKNTQTNDKYSKKTTERCKVIDTSSELIISEREQQILDRVQSSLRKLSPDRKAKTTKEVRDNSPEKTSSILPKTNVAAVSENSIRQTSDNVDKFTNVSSDDKSTLKKNLTNEKPANKSQIPSKPSSRNVSPIKKPPVSSNLPKNASESGKLRSASPKKPITHTDNKPGSPTERPQSPQISKTTIGKTKDVISSQYNRTSSSSAIKNERTNITDSKKTLTNKQQTTKISATKTPTNKPFSSSKPLDVENRRATTPKGIHRDLPLNLKKETDSKVTRTSSDIGINLPGKKISPQRMKSKPEIHITASKVSKQATTAKHQRTSVKESTTKLPVSKPKSAIALNTSIDDEYVIIDVQQAKSSRENSPDRICPTPVGFSEDIGTPRFPDEVNEPDDEYNKYKNHIIHETESIVDDIVEISEEDELFVKRSEVDNEKTDTTDECLLSVNDKVTKFTNQVESQKLKDSTSCFKDTERQIHSDFVDDNLKSDECLLSVSEKVNKFAKGSVGPKDRSPSRNITEEYDRDTIYTDDYTKLSVNDKAHLFIETAENIKTTKPKSIQKPERPNLTLVDDSLKSDECLLSVSDKVNKFVKTAEQVLSDKYVVDEKDKKIKEQHDKIMKQIVNDVEDNLNDVKHKSVPSKHYEPISNDEEKPCGNDSEDIISPKLESITNKIKSTTKSPEKTTPIKITTLRSSESVKKAKALFENIASKSNTKEIHNKNTKLTDLGISKKLTKSISDTNESRKPVSNIIAPAKDKKPTVQQTDYDKEQIKEQLYQRQRSPDHDQISKVPIAKEKSPMTRITSPTTTSRDMSPADRPVSPFTREKTPINRTLSPMAREKSPASNIRSPITRDKSPTTKTRSPVVKEDAAISRTKSPVPQVATITTKKVISRFPVTEQIDSQKQIPLENYDKPIDKVPGYQRPTKTSQIREEKHLEEVDVSSRRGSGKFGVELRRTSADRSSISSERRRSSVEHHQPCIEDIFDIDLLEQMLEKVVGYEQRRRIRAQIRIAKKKFETEQENSKVTKSSKQSAIKITKTKSPERQSHRSPERPLKSQKPQSPERQPKMTPNKTSSPDRQNISTQKVPSFEHHEPKEPLIHSHAKESHKILKDKETRPQSPEKTVKSTLKTVRSSSPDKKSRPMSPSKTVSPKTKGNRFSEYASAYMKKVGINESSKLKQSEVKTKKIQVVDEAMTKKIENNHIVETHRVSKTLSDRTSSKDIIEVVQINGRKPPSPERSFDRYDGSDLIHQSQKQCPERKPSDKTASDRKVSPVRLHQSPERQIDHHTTPKRSPSPVVKKVSKKETTTVLDIEKKIPQKQVQEEKPSWMMNRQLKKVTSDSRTFSSKKIEADKPKYRPSSPSKAITKPIDVITSSYGPGPLDADGKPLFGIKALRNGASNYQVKGTVIRQEFHSRNGGEPEGTVSVTAYSTEPEDLEKLLQSQGEKPSRLHGLAAITTTKKFGGDTGTTLRELSTKEERAALDQFTHSNRRVTESKIDRYTDTFDNREQKYTERKTEECERYGKEKQQESTKRSKVESFKKETRREDSDSQKDTRAVRMQKTERRVEDRKTVRQSSVKSLTEKFIKNASETSKTERTVYPKAGLILRTAGMKDSVSSDSSAHAGLARTDSEHSLGSVEDMVTTTTTTEQVGDVVRTTTTTTKTGGRTQERSFLDSSTKVTGVQDILTRMKNADIVIEEGDTNEDSEARALLNKFLGATVLMAGMQNYVTEKPTGLVVRQETVKTHSSSGAGRVSSSRKVEDFDLEQCWDERVLRKLLDECTDYELRRRLRARIRALMAEQEACASAVTEALAAAGETVESVDIEENQQSGEREEEEVTTVTSSVRRNSSEQTVSSTTVKNTKVIECMTRPAPKPVSPFAKFRQLEKQNSINSPNSPNTPQSPGSPSQPYFKFTDPALQLSAVTIKERLLQWCRDKTRDYENVKLENFSTSWADGLAFCALLHHFLPDAFDYSQLTPDKRRHNFTLAFKIADEKAGIYPLLDVDDMVAMRKPDWKCVFTYVQSIYRRFKDEQ